MQWITNLALLLLLGGIFGLEIGLSDPKDEKSVLSQDQLTTTPTLDGGNTTIDNSTIASSINDSQVQINETSKYSAENATNVVQEETTTTPNNTLNSDSFNNSKNYVENSNNKEIKVPQSNSETNEALNKSNSKEEIFNSSTNLSSLNESMSESEVSNETSKEITNKDSEISETFAAVTKNDSLMRSTAKRSIGDKESGSKSESPDELEKTSDSAIPTTMMVIDEISSFHDDTSDLNNSTETVVPRSQKQTTENFQNDEKLSTQPTVKKCSNSHNNSSPNDNDCEEFSTEAIDVKSISVEESTSFPATTVEIAIGNVSQEPVKVLSMESSTISGFTTFSNVIATTTLTIEEHTGSTSKPHVYSRGERSSEIKSSVLTQSQPLSSMQSQPSSATQNSPSSTLMITTENSKLSSKESTNSVEVANNENENVSDFEVTTEEILALSKHDSLSTSPVDQLPTTTSAVLEVATRVEYSSSSHAEEKDTSSISVQEIDPPKTTSETSAIEVDRVTFDGLSTEDHSIQLIQNDTSNRVVEITMLDDSATHASARQVDTVHSSSPVETMQMDSPKVPFHTKDIGFRKSSHNKYQSEVNNAKPVIEHNTNDHSITQPSINSPNDGDKSVHTSDDETAFVIKLDNASNIKSMSDKMVEADHLEITKPQNIEVLQAQDPKIVHATHDETTIVVKTDNFSNVSEMIIEANYTEEPQNIKVVELKDTTTKDSSSNPELTVTSTLDSSSVEPTIILITNESVVVLKALDDGVSPYMDVKSPENVESTTGQTMDFVLTKNQTSETAPNATIEELQGTSEAPLTISNQTVVPVMLSTTARSRIRKPKLRLNGVSDTLTTVSPRRATTPRARKPTTQKLDFSGSMFKRNLTRIASITSSTTPGSTTRYTFQRASYRPIGIVGTESIPLGMLPMSTTPSTTTEVEEEEEEEEEVVELQEEGHVTQESQSPRFWDNHDVTLIKIAAATVVDKGMRWKKELHTRQSPQYKKQEQRMQKILQKIIRGLPLGINLWKLEIDGFIESYPGSRKVMVDYSVYFVKTDDPVEKLELERTFNEKLMNNSFSRYIFDPAYTQFEILEERKLNEPTEPPELEPQIPQWAIAVIVIGAASFIFIVLFAAVTVYGRHHMRRRYTAKMDDDLERSVESREWEKKLAAAAAYENLAADVVYDVDDSGLENVKRSYYLD